VTSFLFSQNALTRVTGPALRPGGLALTRRAVDVCRFDRDDNILDAGCGYGMTGQYLFEEHGIRAVETDITADRIMDSCLNNPGSKIPGPWFVRSRIPAFPFRPESFTGIFCECVLSLIPDKAACLNEFFRLLKKNGKLVLTDLYIPEGSDTREPGPAADEKEPFSCLDGALTLTALTRAIETAGLTLILMEDHTRYLRQMAGQMVFEYGSLENFWKRLPVKFCSGSVSRACRAGHLKPGYVMMIAQKI
jgi:arsenite methyltransferase